MTPVDSKVSVVLCGYNQAAYIEHAVDSALLQTHPNLEVIIVDNGSTDGSRDRVARYATDPRVRLLLHATNAPVTKRLNEGIAAATGQYISILYADDYYLPRKIERQLQAFSTLSPAYGVVYSPGYREDALTGQRWLESTLKRSGDVLKEMFALHFTEGFINPISPLIRRECFSRYPFHEDVFVEGESIFLRIAVTYKFFYVDEPLTVMREHATNMGKVIKKNAAVALTLMDRVSHEAGFPADLLPALDAFRAAFMANCGWLGIRMAEDPVWARACVMSAVRSHPAQLFRARPLAALALSTLPAAAIRAFNRVMNAFRNNRETVAFKAEYH